MLRGIYSSASGMLVNQKEQDIRSNNLANVNTTGYNRDISVKGDFRDILIRRLEKGKDVSDLKSGIGSIIGHLGTGTTLEESVTSFEPGELKETDNQFDLAIDGEGFFTVEGPGEELYYTRTGSFTLDEEGVLVTQQGHPVLSEGGEEIELGQSEDIYIDREGFVFLDEEEEPSYQLGMNDFENPQGLLKVGENLYLETDVSGEPVELDENTEILQGYLEGSNVNTAKEMAGMIQALRAYESNQMALTTQDEALQQAVNRVGSVQ